MSVPEKLSRPGTFVSNVPDSGDVSTSAEDASKPTSPSAVMVSCSRMPALSSLVVGLAMLEMLATNATRVLPSAKRSAIGISLLGWRRRGGG